MRESSTEVAFSSRAGYTLIPARWGGIDENGRSFAFFVMLSSEETPSFGG
jgi:hypothetical protein